MGSSDTCLRGRQVLRDVKDARAYVGAVRKVHRAERLELADFGLDVGERRVEAMLHLENEIDVRIRVGQHEEGVQEALGKNNDKKHEGTLRCAAVYLLFVSSEYTKRARDRTRIFLLSVIDDPVIIKVNDRASLTIASGMPARR